MSTDTNNSPSKGSSRRRRSRGGQNRNKSNSSNRTSNDGRQPSNGGRPNHKSSSKSQPRRAMPAPKLSWWQKFLNAIGLGSKEAVRPPRPERRPSATDAKQQQPQRSKTRDARTEQSKQPESKKQSTPRSEKNNTRSRGGDPSTVENRRVYVGNLSYDTTESDLEELFKGVGAVRRVEIVYNRSTHRSKGYGFVEMLDIDEAKRTVEVLHDQFFMGRKITVSGAKSKDHDNAEQEEGGTPVATTIPPLAPINPEKEEVHSLVEEPVAAVTTETTNSEAPSEEFGFEQNTTEEAKEEAKA